MNELITLFLTIGVICFLILWWKSQKNFEAHGYEKFIKRCKRFKKVTLFFLFLLSFQIIRLYSTSLDFWINHVATIWGTTIIFIAVSIGLKVLTEFKFVEVIKDDEFSLPKLGGIFIGFIVIAMFIYAVAVSIENPEDVKTAYGTIIK